MERYGAVPPVRKAVSSGELAPLRKTGQVAVRPASEIGQFSSVMPIHLRSQLFLVCLFNLLLTVHFDVNRQASITKKTTELPR